MKPASGFKVPKPGRSKSAGPPQASPSSANRNPAPPVGAESAAGDVRTEKVARLRAAIQAGTYFVSAIAFADKIMQGMFDWDRY